MERMARFFRSYKPVVLLLILYWVMAVTGTKDKSNTFDEIPHLVGGYSYWITGDFRLHPENGLLPQRWAALPLLLTKPKFPPYNQLAWKNADLWNIGYQFFYRMGNHPESMLLCGRSMMALLGMGLGLLIYLWSRQLFGSYAGLLSLTLYAFCPSFLAHGALITTDVAVTFFLSLSVWLLWRLLHEPTIPRIFATGAALACLFLSKASSFLILPMAFLLLVFRVISGKPLGITFHKEAEIVNRKSQLIVLCGVTIVLSMIVVLFIWSSYCFRYSAFEQGQGSGRFFHGWEEITARAGVAGRCISWVRDRKLLPEAYLYGLTYILADQGGRRAFLNGQYSVKGWWYFFPYAFLVKTPLPLLILLAIGLMGLHFSGVPLYETIPIWILLVVYWSFALSSSVNIGQRYLLPVYPALFVLAGSVFAAPVPRVLIGVLLLWVVAESLRIRPDYLAYFNQLAGGPSKGHLHLVDSSLDWGQDLPGLKRWLDQNNLGHQRVFLSYFGTADPGYYGIDAVRLPSYADQRRYEDKVADWTGGIYCISATMLASVYSPAIGPWAAPYEAEYQKWMRWLQERRGPSSDPEIENRMDLLQKLRFARLCAFLRHQKYVDQIGYSVLVYRLTEEQVHQALFGPAAELQDRVRVRGLN